MTKVHQQPAPEKDFEGIYMIDEFNYEKPTHGISNGTLEVWGRIDQGFGIQQFSLKLDSDKLDGLRQELFARGKCDASLGAFQLFMNGSAYPYTHAQKRRYISEWMDKEHERENAALSEPAPLPPGMTKEFASYALYQRWLSQQREPISY